MCLLLCYTFVRAQVVLNRKENTFFIKLITVMRIHCVSKVIDMYIVRKLEVCTYVSYIRKDDFNIQFFLEDKLRCNKGSLLEINYLSFWSFSQQHISTIVENIVYFILISPQSNFPRFIE